jgi:hypothetical protein
MTVNVTTSFVQQFSGNVAMLAQQMTSRLRATVMEAPYVGEGGQVVQQLGTIDLQEVTSRHGDTNYADIAHDARWVYPTDYDRALAIDTEDKLRTLAEWESPYVRALGAGAARKTEDVIIKALFADAKTGKTGATTTSFPAANQVSVSEGATGSTGMNVAKLLKGLQLLRAAEAVDEGEPVYVALAAFQETNLLKETQMISGDYNPNKPLGTGVLPDGYLGITWIRTARLLTDGSGFRRCAMWTKRGMHLGTWKEFGAEVFRDPGKRNMWACQVKGTIGATRVEEARVIELKCSEA